MMAGYTKCASQILLNSYKYNGYPMVCCVACVCVFHSLLFFVSLLCYICCCTTITITIITAATIKRRRGGETMIQVIKDFLYCCSKDISIAQNGDVIVYLIIAIRNAMMIRFKQYLKYKPIYSSNSSECVYTSL